MNLYFGNSLYRSSHFVTATKRLFGVNYYAIFLCIYNFFCAIVSDTTIYTLNVLFYYLCQQVHAMAEALLVKIVFAQIPNVILNG